MSIESRLSTNLSALSLPDLTPQACQRFESYYDLLIRWNQKTNLTAIRDEEGIVRRHFVESIACAYAIPADVASLLDFGSGAGFPGLPIAICRDEIRVTLAESQGKKAAFLREAVRSLGLQAVVHGGRAEELKVLFDCVTMRAVDRMEVAIDAAIDLTRPGGWYLPMSSQKEREVVHTIAGDRVEWMDERRISPQEETLILVGRRK
jgi:16S rRNA (guanine527-N7)-methyltransferase